MKLTEKARRTAALLAAICMIAGVSACGGNETQTTSADAAQTETAAPAETTEPEDTRTTTTTTTAPKVTTTTTTTLPPLPVMETYEDYYARNSDMRGWIKIDGTPIDYPCVQGADNKYYLTHDFDKNEDRNGACFIDYLCDYSSTRTRPANTIIYGHNMVQGPSFAKLTTYCPWYYSMFNKSLAEYLTAPTITYDTVWEQGTYKVFAAMFVNTQAAHGEVFKYYKQRTIKSAGEFYDYIGRIMDRSQFYTDVDLEYGDELLTLSTCYYPLGKEVDTRFVVFARRVREGEDPSVDTSKAYINPSPLYFDYWYKVNGGSWAGRNWDTSKVKGFDKYYETHEVGPMPE